MFTKSIVDSLHICEDHAVPVKNEDFEITTKLITYSHINRPVNIGLICSISRETIFLIDDNVFPIYYINFHSPDDSVLLWWAYENEKEREIDFEKLCKVQV